MTALGRKTGTWSGHGSALKIARWWHCQQHTSSVRTPLARMLPRVIGLLGADRGRLALPATILRGGAVGKQGGRAGVTGPTGLVLASATGLAAADWRILPPSPGGEATLLKIAAYCDERA
jgi:hypothetical protein